MLELIPDTRDIVRAVTRSMEKEKVVGYVQWRESPPAWKLAALALASASSPPTRFSNKPRVASRGAGGGGSNTPWQLNPRISIPPSHLL
jgi:hypothetical protein